MRRNLPVTNNEYVLEDGRPIVSKTDLKGKITYVNPYFIEVSGFDEQELLGEPHNLVRHPDMPVEAFADLWATLKKGEMWTAVVKNRRKNGDYYWVMANVTPTMEDGRIVGYMSVRTKPTRDQIRATEELYCRMRDDKTGKITIRGGQVVERGLRGLLANSKEVELRKRIAAVSILQLMASVVTVSGVIVGCGTPSTMQAASIFAGAVAILMTVYLWYWLQSRLVQPLQEATDIVRRFAGGDLTHTIKTNRRDDMGKLLRGLSQMNVNLVALLGDVRANVLSINGATKEIADGNMDLASRTELQASSLEETATSMEEFASAVRKNAEHAQKANHLVESASNVAARGGAMAGKVGETMSEIVGSSQKISDIISIIDGIAFQTNILSLNAAVEAARAGEHGRGFAVVATEVRTLAQRSALAAKEINSLICASVERVETGGQIVEQTQQTMQDILSSVKRAAAIVSEITLASNEQAIGVQQVNQAISHLDKVTQQNATLVEQVATASASLHEQAARLGRTVSVFNVGRRDA